jgi:hypothetical protein
MTYIKTIPSESLAVSRLPGAPIIQNARAESECASAERNAPVRRAALDA